MEDDFAFQLEEQERHYGPYLNSALSAEAAAAEVRIHSRGMGNLDIPLGRKFYSFPLNGTFSKQWLKSALSFPCESILA